jgi:Uma2 family endonuclease
MFPTLPPRGEKLRTCPEIVVEVISEGEAARRRDLVEKPDLRLRRGALEYWIADLAARTLLRLIRSADAWRDHRFARALVIVSARKTGASLL